jgi:hypothetical protein
MAAFLLSGSLDEIGLPDVARLLNATQKTGRLAVTGAGGGGSIFFERGEIVEAQSSIFASVDALKHIGLFGRGSFEFVDGEIPPSRHLATTPTNDLIRTLEARVIEARQLQELMPGPRDIPKYLGGAIPAGFEVSAAELAVALKSSTGNMTAEQLSADLNLDLLMVRYTSARFCAAGLMEVAQSTAPAPTPSAPASASESVQVPGGHTDSTSTAPKFWRGRRIG